MKSTLTLIIASLLAPLASAAQWDYPATSDKVLNEAQALAFVEKYYPQVGQPALHYRKTSLLGTHYNFDLTQNGEVQAQKRWLSLPISRAMSLECLKASMIPCWLTACRVSPLNWLPHSV